MSLLENYALHTMILGSRTRKPDKDVCRNMDMHAEKHRDEWFLSNGKPAMPRFA
jgi:hypothetical protein